MKFRLVPVPRMPADFPMESLFDADQDSAYRAINDWGFTPRAFFTVEAVPEEVYEHDSYHV